MKTLAAKEKNLLCEDLQLAENSRLGFTTLSTTLHQENSQNKPLIALENSDSLTQNSVRFVYTWNARNQLVAISGSVTASFSYDALGRRVSKTINGVRTDYQYDKKDIVVEIGSGAVGATYVRGLRMDDPFMRQTATTSEFYHTDALGSVFALTDVNGNTTTSYTYDPFGNTTQTGISSNPFQYTGRENDGTGLYFYRNRNYNPSLQRFISEDPIRFRGGFDFYAYTGDNPVNWNDPLGLIYGSVGAGGWGNIGPTGMGADSGFAVDSSGAICFYTNTCSSLGWNTLVGGSLGPVAQGGSGNLCSGTTKSYGIYWYGGKGKGAEGQIFFDESGNVAYGRGIGGPLGVTSGAGAGYITCETQYFCHNESDNCKKKGGCKQ